MSNGISTLSRPNGWSSKSNDNMKKIFSLAALAAAVLAFGAAASAQTLERVNEYAEIAGVNVMDGPFEVSLVHADKYSVKLVTDAVISEFVSSTLRDKTVYISYDSKNVPKEVKKLYKGRKNPDPVLQVIIYAPEIQELALSDKCTFTAAEQVIASRFDLNLADNASVKSLRLKADNVGLSLRKKSSAVLDLIVPGSLTISSEGSSNVRSSGVYGSVSVMSAGSSTVSVEGDCDELSVRSEGSSQVNVSTKTGKASVDVNNTSKTGISGSASELVITGRNNATADVRNLDIPAVTVTLNSATAHVGAKKQLTLELTGGAEVFYEGEPQFIIKKIVKSTLAPAGTK